MHKPHTPTVPVRPGFHRHRTSRSHPTRPRFFALALACAFALAVVACKGDDGSCSSGENDLNGEYSNAAYDLEMFLDHNCGSGSVVGTFYDENDFAYDLEGTVMGDDFEWEAVRELPGGGTDIFYSQTSMQIQSLGLSFSGRVLKNGAGPASPITFELQ